MLCSYAYDLVKNTDLAEEVVQEMLIKIWENRINLNITTSLKSYLFRSIHNQCINILKHNRVVSNQAGKYSEEMHFANELALFPNEEYTLDGYFYDGLEKDIEQAILTLPDQCRSIFRMSRFELKSYEEIALNLGISVNTVKTQMRRALDKLRTIISKKIADKAKISDI